ncbi:MAG: histidine kinase dimerization/phosphoacceptor domain -containing protein [Xanthobacteraceae bacterium]
MNNSEEQVRKLLRQQAAIALFGSFALRQTDLLKVLTEAARVCAEGLSVPFCKVCRYRTDENDLLIEAGYGWQKGVVGHVVSRADTTSPQGRAFMTGLPSICNDLRKDNDFKLPAFYAAHKIVSTIDVVIKGNGKPYGVLEIDNDKQHDYDQHDVDFLTGFANVLAEAVATSKRAAIMEKAVEQMKRLVEEKDRLLDQKKILAEELQHRVRNNLQLIYGMLNKRKEDAADAGGQKRINAIARRVSTMAQVYNHLLGTEMTRTTDFGSFVKSLCLNLAEFQATPSAGITLTCESESFILDLDVVTALGLVVAELVTNSYDHAFPAGKGTIAVAAHRDATDPDTAVLTLSDNGAGFEEKNGSKRKGLGLVRRLIEQVRGTVVLESTDGTVWTIKFPTATALAAAA